MKTLSVALVSVVCSVTVWAAPPVSDPSVSVGEGGKSGKVLSDYEMVCGADWFSIGGVGIAGTISVEETALRRMLERSDAEAECRRLVVDGSRAGQLYGLLGLKLIKAADYDTVAKPFRKSRKEVTTTAGCIVMKEPMADVMKQIDKGGFR